MIYFEFLKFDNYFKNFVKKIQMKYILFSSLLLPFLLVPNFNNVQKTLQQIKLFVTLKYVVKSETFHNSQ